MESGRLVSMSPQEGGAYNELLFKWRRKKRQYQADVLSKSKFVHVTKFGVISSLWRWKFVKTMNTNWHSHKGSTAGTLLLPTLIFGCFMLSVRNRVKTADWGGFCLTMNEHYRQVSAKSTDLSAPKCKKKREGGKKPRCNWNMEFGALKSIRCLFSNGHLSPRFTGAQRQCCHATLYENKALKAGPPLRLF